MSEDTILHSVPKSVRCPQDFPDPDEISWQAASWGLFGGPERDYFVSRRAKGESVGLEWPVGGVLKVRWEISAWNPTLKSDLRYVSCDVLPAHVGQQPVKL